MTLDQEFLGWKVTMQSLDRAVHLAAHGTEADLENLVAVPKDFIKSRKHFALVFTDQVPVWIARQKKKVVFAEREQATDSKQSKKLKGGVEVTMRSSDIQWSQKMPPKLQETSVVSYVHRTRVASTPLSRVNRPPRLDR